LFSKFAQAIRNSPLNRVEQISIIPQIIRWLVIASIAGALAGTASAGFLYSLEWATDFRENHIWLIALLPLGGLSVGLVYHWLGKKVEGGNNLILDEIHDPSGTIPLRMMPLVLGGTVITHFFGGSAGREGTAIQMAASLADQLNVPLRMNADDRRILLTAGVSAGFASVFGIPLAGAVFGLEVLSFGKMKYDAIFPSFIAAIVGNAVTLAWGTHHTQYVIASFPAITTSGLLWAIFAGACFGTVGMLFGKTTHWIGAQFKKHISYGPFRPLVGGAIVAVTVWLIGTTKYIGLGVPTTVEAFKMPLPPWDFAGKLIFTAVTLGSGFKGGEVTPLFYIGATLGNALSYFVPLEPSLLAGMGFVGVFAGAANTPISSTLMAIELFGGKAGVFAGVACVVSYLFSGHSSIYHSQRIGDSKHKRFSTYEGISLKELEKKLKTHE
jgi:H+/Cl- antiporter ClcA